MLEELRLVHEMLYAKDAGEFSFEIPDTTEVEEDGVLLSAKQQYEAREQGIWMEIENIQSRFPFVARETLQNEELTKEYLKSLESRMNSCSESLTELNGQITEMLGV